MSSRIRFANAAANYHRDQQAITDAITSVLESGRPVMGPDVKAFEEEFAAYVGAGYAVGVMSGSSALVLALRSLGIGPGDEVITVANSDIPTSHAVALVGARLVWADIDGRNFNIDPDQIEERITDRTKVLMPVHMYGIPAEMDRILDIARRHGLAVVEDACLAVGASYRGRRVGSLGTVNAFSTSPNKMLGGVGSGGAITTDQVELYDRLNALRYYGKDASPYALGSFKPAGAHSKAVAVGYNERLDSIQAAVLRIRLRRLDADVARRREIALMYADLLDGSDVRLPAAPPGAEPCWHSYTVRLPAERRDTVYESLYERGIETVRRYIPPNHLEECYQSLGYREGDLPETEAVARELLGLPCHPFLTDEEVGRVARELLDLL
ncbi:MAG: DegT/DnrJ/EryC1/StrS family aminotransferase [Thermaerobacterales bacterium]